MRTRFDQIGKQIGKEALDASGRTVAHDEILAEVQHADLRHEPDPARQAERARLGLLGRLAATPCLIEVYSHAPGPGEMRACLSKHFAFWQKRTRQARKKQGGDRPVEPFLWIITAGRPDSVLSGGGFADAPGWPEGVYLGPELFRTGVLVASELPCDRTTLLVRLMAAGRLLPAAIAELSALPAEAHEHTLAGPVLLRLRHALQDKPNKTRIEQEFIVSTQNIVEKLVEQGRREGRKETRLEMGRAAIRRVLAVRKLTLGAEDEARIDACTKLATLERWHERAVVAETVAAVFK